MEKGRPVEVSINSRIVVDAAYFKETNPNYKRPSITKPSKQTSSSNIWISMDLDGTSESSSDVVKSIGKNSAEVAGDDVLICSPTVLGFSLNKKLWRKHPGFQYICGPCPADTPTVEFAVDDIMDIKWQPAALAHLQIPEKKKKAI